MKILTTYCIVMSDDRVLSGANASAPELAIQWFMKNVSAPGVDWTFHTERGVRVLPFSITTKK